ncbi:MAG: hypothetical protein LBJ23_05805 [Tannerella sp.]|jgi:hypothetical protein|nr:hypothetical protein [Tannerella sp.]
MNFKGNELTTGEMFRHVYSGISAEDLERKSCELMTAWGYRLKSREGGQAVFEKGNRTARLLLGALVKYFKTSIRVTPAGPDELKCEVRSLSSGFSGGLIGINRMKNEMKALFAAFQQL